jgi:hypothetical protein
MGEEPGWAGIDRREFLLGAAGGAAALTAAAYSRMLGVEEKLRLGVIGCGERGHNLCPEPASLQLLDARVANARKCLPRW